MRLSRFRRRSSSRRKMSKRATHHRMRRFVSIWAMCSSSFRRSTKPGRSGRKPSGSLPRPSLPTSDCRKSARNSHRSRPLAPRPGHHPIVRPRLAFRPAEPLFREPPEIRRNPSEWPPGVAARTALESPEKARPARLPGYSRVFPGVFIPMAGHSHSANIAHRKGLVDAKRGKLFSKLCRAIYVAARTGGGDPAANIRLRYAIDKARSFSCPKDNIERSIKKATGELGADNFEEVLYEGYGPGGVAVLCEALTDNRNRTAGELRRAFEAAGGNLGASGCVSYLFNFKGLFVVDPKHVSEDHLMEIALEAGADDVELVEGYFEVTCDPKIFDAVRRSLEEHKIPTESAETSYIPTTYVDLDAEGGRKMLKLKDILEENDDVQNVYANDNIPEEVLAG